MKRWLFAVALCLLPGCDVATVALIMGSSDSGSSSDDAPLPAPDPGFVDYRVWTAHIDPVGALAEENRLISKNGDPSNSTWTETLPGSDKSVFNPDAVATDINAILIQVSSKQNYALDSVEVLDALQDSVLEVAPSGSTWASLVSSEDNITGPPDGVVAVTGATAPTVYAFIFTIFNGAAGIPRFRINGHGDNLPANPGEVVALGGGTESFFNERPGGMAIDPGSGLIHVTLSIIEDDKCRLTRYSIAGVKQDDEDVSLDIATAGSHSVALNAAGVVFTACSVGSGLVQVRSFAKLDLTPINTVGFTSGFNNDRVEHNSIAVDNAGFVIVVGGMNTLNSGRNHWRIKLPDTLTDPPVWQNSSPLDSTTTTTYWHAVATDANNNLFMAGDLNSGLLGTIQIYTARFNSAGSPQWDESFDEGGAPSDLAHAIALDNSGSLVYVGGTAGTTANAKDGALVRYTSSGSLTSQNCIVLSGPGDDEILDIAVDPQDGSVYVVGYETVTGQGENMVIRKYVWNPNFDQFVPVWGRTVDGGFGNDRAVSCALYQDKLVVAGYQTNSTGQTKFALRIYAK